MTDHEIAYKIRGCIYTVYRELGPGLLETIYEEALAEELTRNGLYVERQKDVPVIYKGLPLKTWQRLDLLVEHRVIVELKAVEDMKALFYKQTYCYLRVTGFDLAVLVNFNCDDITHNMHNLYRKKKD